ncbi:MAG TPA: glycosyltransferase family 4 protein [Candidatus Poseidoniaceae archaeon]|nr:MAG TPA: hypothetical protein D7I07_04420 [Candidatus Poseidoniales archaeon]HII37728.1 glycosyltransferase family 4 protein [Candidatus Poseidoniaceae archaeon]|tara:strand:- start:2364 stop:3464 length:1101 start_codon:yes stop_codon:yes gene_type:complete
MRILWFSANSYSDMCFTSQRELANGLTNSGLDVHLINEDSSIPDSDTSWRHVGIKSSQIAGLKGYSLAKNMAKWLSGDDHSEPTVAVVDWRLITQLCPVLSKKNIPWILLDRSPPADVGLLAKLQWSVWRRAWRLVAKHKHSKGVVVSPKHQQFVQSRVAVDSTKFTQLPAGVNLDTFAPAATISGLKLVYHGRLDKHRGILALPMLVRKCQSAGIDVSLKLIGDGDCYTQLSAIAADMNSISVYPQMSLDEVAEHLRDSTIGLLPMPELDVWAISSPLKRSEYCASGLLIFGVDHAGHRFDDNNYDWMKLVPQYDFHQDCIAWLSKLTQREISKLSQASRNFAEQELGWEHSINALVECIQSLND